MPAVPLVAGLRLTAKNAGLRVPAARLLAQVRGLAACLPPLSGSCCITSCTPPQSHVVGAPTLCSLSLCRTARAAAEKVREAQGGIDLG